MNHPAAWLRAAISAFVLGVTAGLALPAAAEAPFLAERVASGDLKSEGDRLPNPPLVVDLAGRGRTIGQYGGDIRTLVAKARDLRYLTVMGYTRLVGYDETIKLKPDLLEKVDNDGDRVFTFTLRAGHRWSDGEPFTTEDFRFWWEDVALNPELSPHGPPDFLMVEGEKPKVEIIDGRRIRYSWSKPNPRFLPMLALPRPYWIYSPAHYLKKHHNKYTDPAKLDEEAKTRQMASWATLYNKLDDPYEAGNPKMPVLDPWHVITKAPAQQFIFERNPYFHRIDAQGQQLPYIDRIVVDVAATSLFAAKANAGEVDLLTRGIATSDIPLLKEGEGMHGYHTLVWPIARGSAFALFPDLTTSDPVWRTVIRDVRFRRALSLAIDRHALNNALWFRLGSEGNNTVMRNSPLFTDDLRTGWAYYDPKQANDLLDQAGLKKRDPAGFRLLPDGRLAELIVEVEGESREIIDALEITEEFWHDVGLKIIIKPEDGNDLRKRAFSGLTLMVAAQGMDNAIPTALMPPRELAPLGQDHMSWPKWGQYAETAGAAGEKPDMPEVQELLTLYSKWMDASSIEEKTKIWQRMLGIHADQQFTIGTVQGALQPIIVANSLRNIPKKAVYSWEPTAMLGAYRIDEFYYDHGAATTGATQ